MISPLPPNMMITSDCGCQPDRNFEKLPVIQMTVQTTVNGSDIGDALFEIYDKYQYYLFDQKDEILDLQGDPKYYKECEIKDDKYQITHTNHHVKVTKFHKCCPFIVSVLKGKGKTAFKKVNNIYNKYAIKIGVSLVQFGINIITYAMAKYVLSRLLYGKFNINFLLGIHNKKFLKDLGKTRFQDFLEFFLDPNSPVFGYNKYFKCDKEQTKIHTFTV